MSIGKHTVRVEKKGYKSETREAVVQDNAVCLVRLELKPLK